MIIYTINQKSEPPNLYITNLWKTNQKLNGILKELIRILTHTLISSISGPRMGIAEHRRHQTTK